MNPHLAHNTTLVQKDGRTGGERIQKDKKWPDQGYSGLLSGIGGSAKRLPLTSKVLVGRKCLK